MSVFKKRLKTFESDITGEKKTYKVNNAFWLFLEEDFKISQGDLQKENEKNYPLTAAKTIVCILKANKIETTLDEVLENTNELELLEFITSFNNAMVDDEPRTKSEKTETKDKEGKQKS